MRGQTNFGYYSFEQKRIWKDLMKPSTALSLTTLLIVASLPAAAKVCDARTYGAKHDGTTKNTKAIQDAINDCSGSGGGTVKLIGRPFVSGPIVLRSQVTLDI